MGEKFAAGLAQIGFSADEISVITKKMTLYVNEIITFNKVHNLVNSNDPEEIEVHHLLDCLAAVPVLREKADYITSLTQSKPVTIADIGSGGGLPGIPLAAAMSDCHFILVERMQKRCLFLENVIAVLGLQNVTVKCSRAEEAGSSIADIVTYRAFHPLDGAYALTLLRLTRKPGCIIAYKARSEKIREEMESVKEKISSYKMIPLTVPFLTENTIPGEERERNLVLIPKE